jgi:hypothetical protein
MPRAVIQGEVHVSRGDKAAMAERLDRVDALLRESMEQDMENSRHPLYLLLFIGMKLFRNTVQRVLYVSDRPVFDLAAQRGVDVVRMDISVANWTRDIGPGKHWLIFGLAGLVSYGSVPVSLHPVMQGVIGIILFILLYFLYAALLTIPERDRLMAGRVQHITAENGYETVLVSVGDAHIRGIAERLETAGWEVETYESNTLFGRILRPIMNALNRVLG